MSFAPDVRHLGLLVQLATDAVPDQLTDDPELSPPTVAITAAPMSPTWLPGTAASIAWPRATAR